MLQLYQEFHLDDDFATFKEQNWPIKNFFVPMVFYEKSSLIFVKAARLNFLSKATTATAASAAC